MDTDRSPATSRHLLIADTDSATLDRLPHILCDRIPNLELHLCTSVNQAAQKLQLSHYDTIISSIPLLLAQDFVLLKRKLRLQPLAPLIVTAGQSDAQVAIQALQEGAFDLIAKPIQASEAAKSIRLALWHNGLLKLLASRDKDLLDFQQHMETYPHDQKKRERFRQHLTIFDRAFQAIETSLQRIEKLDYDLFFQMAACVEKHTNERALDRLLHMCSEETLH